MRLGPRGRASACVGLAGENARQGACPAGGAGPTGGRGGARPNGGGGGGGGIRAFGVGELGGYRSL